MERIPVGTIGTVLECRLLDQDGEVVDISAASSKSIEVRPPHQATAVRAASFATDGTDGRIQIAALEADLAQSGKLSIRPIVVVGGQTLTGFTTTIQVEPSRM